MPEVLFERLDDHVVRATAATTGPWYPHAQHGAPPSGLLGHLLADTLAPHRFVRCTIDLLGPVPVAELRTSVEVLHRTGRTSHARITLSSGGATVATALGWGLSERDVPLPADRPDGDVVTPAISRPPDGDGQPMQFESRWDGYWDVMRMDSVEGGFATPGDAVVWLRPDAQLFEDVPLTPLHRVLLTADFGSGVAARLDFERWLYVNVDLTIQLRDLPEGDWVGLDAATRFGPDGIGTATTTLHGAQGPIGTCLQSLLLDRR